MIQNTPSQPSPENLQAQSFGKIRSSTTQKNDAVLTGQMSQITSLVNSIIKPTKDAKPQGSLDNEITKLETILGDQNASVETLKGVHTAVKTAVKNLEGGSGGNKVLFEKLSTLDKKIIEAEKAQIETDLGTLMTRLEDHDPATDTPLNFKDIKNQIDQLKNDFNELSRIAKPTEEEIQQFNESIEGIQTTLDEKISEAKGALAAKEKVIQGKIDTLTEELSAYQDRSESVSEKSPLIRWGAESYRNQVKELYADFDKLADSYKSLEMDPTEMKQKIHDVNHLITNKQSRESEDVKVQEHIDYLDEGFITHQNPSEFSPISPMTQEKIHQEIKPQLGTILKLNLDNDKKLNEALPIFENKIMPKIVEATQTRIQDTLNDKLKRYTPANMRDIAEMRNLRFDVVSSLVAKDVQKAFKDEGFDVDPATCKTLTESYIFPALQEGHEIRGFELPDPSKKNAPLPKLYV